jgi:hypothetical protein
LYICPEFTSHLKQRNYEKGIIFIFDVPADGGGGARINVQAQTEG